MPQMSANLLFAPPTLANWLLTPLRAATSNCRVGPRKALEHSDVTGRGSRPISSPLHVGSPRRPRELSTRCRGVVRRVRLHANLSALLHSPRPHRPHSAGCSRCRPPAIGALAERRRRSSGAGAAENRTRRGGASLGPESSPSSPRGQTSPTKVVGRRSRRSSPVPGASRRGAKALGQIRRECRRPRR